MDFSILIYVLNTQPVLCLQITNEKTMGQSLNKLAHRIRQMPEVRSLYHSLMFFLLRFLKLLVENKRPSFLFTMIA